MYGVILAGGGGTRLWPASRRKKPKQFLPLLPGGRTLLGATVDRLATVLPHDRILVVTAEGQLDEVLAAAPALSRDNIVVEPCARNTAPCIGLAAIEVARRDPKGVMAVVPSDQFVGKETAYGVALATACAAASEGFVVTIGIRPTRPETGFGYINTSSRVLHGAQVVERFVEKPDLATARAYVESGAYLWNSGMFFFRATHLLDAIRRHMPDLAALLDEIRRAPERGPELYPKAPSTSIDYGVMERLGAGEVLVVPGDFDWNDVGSFAALHDIGEPDEHGNVKLGESVFVDAQHNVVLADGTRVVAVLGVSGLVVVSTHDAVLIMPRERAQDVREIVKALEHSKRDHYL